MDITLLKDNEVKANEEIHANHIEIMVKLHIIELQLKDKENRKQ